MKDSSSARSTRGSMGRVTLPPSTGRRASGHVLPREPEYEIVSQLGHGGMATVYLARQLGAADFERLVALKRLHAHLARDAGMVKRFVREARIASHIHHANVVAVQHVGKDDEGYYLVFDYVEGDSLQGLVDRAKALGERLSPGVVLRILLDALEGLHAAHEARDREGRELNVLHRDATPQNILVGRDGVGRIADFGLSQASLATLRTAPGVVMGKILYMAPEYLREQQVDRRIDLYAIGMSAWVALTGARPFVAESEAALLHMVLDGELRSPGELAPYLSDELCALILKACAKSPEARFSTAREMAQAIEALPTVASYREVSAEVERLLGAELSSRRTSLRRLSTAPLPERAPSWLPMTAPVVRRSVAPSLVDAQREHEREVRRHGSLGAAMLAIGLFALGLCVPMLPRHGAPLATSTPAMQEDPEPAPAPEPPDDCPLPGPWCDEAPEPLRVEPPPAAISASAPQPPALAPKAAPSAPVRPLRPSALKLVRAALSAEAPPEEPAVDIHDETDKSDETDEAQRREAPEEQVAEAPSPERKEAPSPKPAASVRTALDDEDDEPPSAPSAREHEQDEERPTP